MALWWLGTRVMSQGGRRDHDTCRGPWGHLPREGDTHTQSSVSRARGDSAQGSQMWNLLPPTSSRVSSLLPTAASQAPSAMPGSETSGCQCAPGPSTMALL